MHENNFEKQVQEKMDQLGFEPSDAVWTAVDKEINKNKKRRRPLFILFLFSGLLLAGGAIYVGTFKNFSDKKIISKEQKKNDEDQNKSSGSKVQSASILENKLNKETKNQVKQNNTNPLNGRQSTESVMMKSGNKPASAYNSKVITDERKNKTEENTGIGKNDNTNSENSGSGRLDSAVVNKTATAAGLTTVPKDSKAESKLATKDKTKSKSALWTLGLTGGAGISNINQSLFKQSNVTGLYYNSNANVASGAPAPVPASSEINPGFSFSAGVFLSRYLSKRISIAMGLNYHYYSTHIKTGYPVDSSIIVYNPANYFSGAPTIPGAYAINGYYQSGSSHSYTNQYHFIELPVTADFQLNKSKELPIFWEAGLSVSYLLASNALHFDPNGNLYYQNALLFNKVQLNGTTSFMIGFPLNKNELRLGPELQYGFSGLLKSGSGNPQHLFYTGLKLSFIHGKK